MALARTLIAILLATAAPTTAAAQAPSAAAAPAGPATIYRMQQIFVGPLKPELMQQMQPMHTLDQVEALLKANRITFGWREADVSSAQLPADLLRQVANLPPHEVFIVPQGQTLVISVIIDSRPAPAMQPAPPASFAPKAPPPKR